ncbi:hypothetical protein [Thioalkalivibrio sp. ALE31]|uniref:hypothetical protein n=1 Tax=Thioalkalivibrio sp. ALE31 TaxID=1158182 RepID=UPI00036720F0|nr:hypothetical protein [Thioalkalivibrio sp. ALE31]
MNCNEATRSATWPRYPRDRRTIATHEAGHLVAWLAFGLTPARLDARLAPCGTGGAVTRLDATGQPASAPGTLDPLHRESGNVSMCFERQCLQWAAMFCAGYAAETRLHGVADRDSDWWQALAGEPDMKNAAAFVSFGYPDRAEALTSAWQHASELLAGHWRWVQRVAREIERTGHCSGEQAVALK